MLLGPEAIHHNTKTSLYAVIPVMESPDGPSIPTLLKCGACGKTHTEDEDCDCLSLSQT